jgi:hypothetical protein
MRRLSALLLLSAWLLASGAQWDLLQSFAWGRMIANYSRTMPVAEAVRLTFTPDNLCGMCSFVAVAKTRADGTSEGRPHEPAPVDPGAKAKAPLAAPPEHLFIFSSAPVPEWPAECFRADARARPAPPTEPPRAV